MSKEGLYLASCKNEVSSYLFYDEKVDEIEISQVEKPHEDHDAYRLFYYKSDESNFVKILGCLYKCLVH